MSWEERFFDKVKKTESCWVWTAARNQHGYGKFAQNRSWKLAHRVSWTLHKGPIPGGLHVLHKCDNPACVNPGHLFIGDHSTNMADCLRKGRRNSAKGENSGKAKLTADDVREIRRLRDDGWYTTTLGKKFGVSTTAIRYIVIRKNWSHLT